MSKTPNAMNAEGLLRSGMTDRHLADSHSRRAVAYAILDLADAVRSLAPQPVQVVADIDIDSLRKGVATVLRGETEEAL